MHIFNQGRHGKFLAGKTATVGHITGAAAFYFAKSRQGLQKIEIGNADFSFLVELPILR